MFLCLTIHSERGIKRNERGIIGLNNNIDRITKGLAEACKECITVAVNDKSAKKEVMRGGGSSGGIMTRLLIPRPITQIRISEDALKLCLWHDVKPYDYFILTQSQKSVKKKI